MERIACNWSHRSSNHCLSVPPITLGREGDGVEGVGWGREGVRVYSLETRKPSILNFLSPVFYLFSENMTLQKQRYQRIRHISTPVI